MFYIVSRKYYDEKYNEYYDTSREDADYDEDE